MPRLLSDPSPAATGSYWTICLKKSCKDSPKASRLSYCVPPYSTGCAAPLCDAVLQDTHGSGQKTLEYLERSNLFIVSLDDERRWYRYHHLFADLLRQRLRQSIGRTQGR